MLQNSHNIFLSYSLVLLLRVPSGLPVFATGSSGMAIGTAGLDPVTTGIDRVSAGNVLVAAVSATSVFAQVCLSESRLSRSRNFTTTASESFTGRALGPNNLPTYSLVVAQLAARATTSMRRAA
jgi:hypothetical protein